MGYQLGIDLGTTYTAAAVSRASDRQQADPEMVSLGDRAVQVPSVVYVAPDGSVLVGGAAERRALTDPGRVVREFKRQVGDETPLVVGGTAYTAHDLVAMTVAWVVERVAEREGGPARRIALTHPASWGAHKKDLLNGALAARGLSVTFLAEPQAAALSYAAAARVEQGSTVAVYDLGGGTFDSAVVHKNGTFTVLGHPEGIDRLGGIDFDDAVFTHVREAIGEAFDGLDPADEAVVAAVSRLRRECVEAKEALSSDTEARIAVLLPGLQTAVRLTRGEFETMIRPQLEESVEALRRAVVSAGLDPADLTAVLLVGGSSRIPLVSQLVSAAFDRPVAVDADPKNAIALGAALSISPGPESRPAVPPPPAAPGGEPVAGVPSARPVVGAATGAPEQPAPADAATHQLPVPDPPRPVHRAAASESPPPVGVRARRPVGLIFGAGGLFVAAAIAAGLLFSPDRGGTTPTGGTTTTVVEIPQVAAIPDTEESAPIDNNRGGAGQGGSGREAPANPGGGAPPADSPPPPAETLEEKPPPHTATPTTAPTTPPSTEPVAPIDPVDPVDPPVENNEPPANADPQPADEVEPDTQEGAEGDARTDGSSAPPA